MTRQSYEAWLNASNITALLLVGLVVVEVAAVLTAGLWQSATQMPWSAGSCAHLIGMWPDRGALADLLSRADDASQAALCTVGLFPRISCVLALPIGLIWMTTYWVIRVNQTGSAFVLGDDFIRLFFIAVCVGKFATGPYSALISGDISLGVLIAVYLLASLVQVFVVFLFQRRLNELVFISLRD